SFDFSISKAGARGLVQFIPSTYKLIGKSRPELDLIEDFAKGMTDHKNAIKAQVALLDSELQSMPDSVKKLYITDRSKAAEFLAAAYNGGSTRVRWAFEYWGNNWSQSHQTDLVIAQSQVKTTKSEITLLKKKIKKAVAKDLKALKKSLQKAETVLADANYRAALIKKKSLRQETVLYVTKLQRVYAMLSAGLFATPNAPSGGLPIALAKELPTASLLDGTATLPNTTAQPSAATPPSTITPPVTALPSPTPPAGPQQICFSDGGCIDLQIGTDH
ncbi:transglycosylase SLT domain-containing protein, partial [Candidatus Uhrbacteria bacterium]|nr:transglycosylase SLT domain-containing protein [Candidatus Uhrbacteria bacterium]